MEHPTLTAQAKQTLPMDMPEMVRLATIPATQLLAETRSALLLVDVQNRFIFGASEASPAPTVRVMQPIERLLRTARSSRRPALLRHRHAPGQVRMPRRGCGGSTTWART
jgi:isochorismate hydrolase